MSFPPRRVVTAHDEQGKPMVVIDKAVHTARSLRPGHTSCVLWATESVPADNYRADDGADLAVGRSLERGTVFRITRYEPGVASAVHQTPSIDYAVVLSGEIDLVLGDEVVSLSAGDVVVQRGTMHDWVNNGTEPCVIAFCLVGALSGTAGEHS